MFDETLSRPQTRLLAMAASIGARLQRKAARTAVSGCLPSFLP